MPSSLTVFLAFVRWMSRPGYSRPLIRDVTVARSQRPGQGTSLLLLFMDMGSAILQLGR